MIKERALLAPKARQVWSNMIFEKIVSHPLYLRAREIYCYVSFREEVSTYGLISYSLKKGKKVAVPKIIVDNRLETKMEFYYINCMEELQKGYFGIMEPPTKTRACGKEVLVVMPGVVFDVHCNRIGYGKGFYDAYLTRHMDYSRIALAYGMQCLESIPADRQDVQPEIIVTERKNYSNER